MAWLLWLASVLWFVPLFWWCCCRAGACSLPCCRNGTAPASSLTAHPPGFEFIFTSFPSVTTSPWFCTPGTCEGLYEGVSIILDYNITQGECTWEGLGVSQRFICNGLSLVEMPRVFLNNAGCSSDRKQLRFIVSAEIYPGLALASSVITITSATAGDVICNTLASGTLAKPSSSANACQYNGAQFTIQAIP